MLYNLKLKLTSPFLGEQRNADGRRRFRMTDSGDFEVPMPQWQWALKEATDALCRTDLLVENIRFTVIRPPAIVLYNRRWRDNGKPREEMFEAFREGTVITVPFYVPAVPDVDLPAYAKMRKPPGKEELELLFSFIGEVLGLSPWGSKFGYGKFEVISITENVPTQESHTDPG